MCFFHYSICDNCRFPSTTHATLAHECLGFLEQLNHSRDTKPFGSPKRDPLTMLHEEGLLEGGSAWQLQGSHTAAQQVLGHGDKCFDLSWDIRPQRKCVRWIPEPVKWVCECCRTAGEQATEGVKDVESEVFELAPETASEPTQDNAVPDPSYPLDENGDEKHEAVRTAWRKVGRKLLGRALSASNGEAPDGEAPNGEAPPPTP